MELYDIYIICRIILYLYYLWDYMMVILSVGLYDSYITCTCICSQLYDTCTYIIVGLYDIYIICSQLYDIYIICRIILYLYYL